MKTITRTEAARLITSVLEEVYNVKNGDVLSGESIVAILTDTFARYGLEIPRGCDGAAHQNLHIDNCMRCAPHYGMIIEPIEVK